MQIADLSRIVDHCVMMTAVYQVGLWKDVDVTGGLEGFDRSAGIGEREGGYNGYLIC